MSDSNSASDVRRGGGAPTVLSGIRVIDMSRVIAGPAAGQTLADLGADVVKIERREGGEDLRSLGPPWMKDATGHDTAESTYFQAVNRGKRSLGIDFTKPAGAAVIRRLAATSDVLLENFRTGTLAKYGLGYDDLKAVNPRLIYCSITGFGQTGPYADRSGYDYLVQAMGGMMAMNGHRDEAPGAGPMRVGIPLADLAAGSNATVGILAALLHREKTGRGQAIDIALFDSQVALLMNGLASWLNGGSVLPRTGNDHPTAVPNGVFPTRDGYVLVSTFNDREFVRVAEALGHPEWATDTRFVRSQDRVAHRRTLVDLMSTVTRTADTQDWIARFNAANISCGPINAMADIERDPQIAARDMIVTLPHAQKGPVRMAGSPLKMSETPPRLTRPPPLAGEHSDEILRELGFDANAIADLRAQNIV